MIRRVPAFDDERGCPFEIEGKYQRKLSGVQGRPSFRVQEQPLRQRLGDVSQRDVIAEGVYSGRRARDQWRAEWLRDHDRWAKRHPTTSDADLIAKRWALFAERYCWVLVVALIDPVRCMADQRDILSGRTQHGNGDPRNDQYVSSGGIDPYAEAVDAQTLIRLTVQGYEAQQRGTRRQRRAARRERLFEGGSP